MKKYFKNEQVLAQKGESILNLSEAVDSAELFSYFLRDHRGRKDLAALVDIMKPNSDENFVRNIEKIRTHFENAEFDQAKKLIGLVVTESTLENLELTLEKARLNYFQGDWQQSRTLLQYLTNHPETLPTSRLTAYQILGLCYYEELNLNESIAIFEKAVKIWDLYPYAYSGAVAAAYLIKIYCEQNQENSAKELLDYFAKNLEQINSEDSWIAMYIIYLRAQFHFYKNSNFSSAKIHFAEALVIARWSEDWQVIAKSEKDILEYPSLNKVEESHSLRGKTWVYLPESKILLHSRPKKVFKLDDSPILNSLMVTLMNRPLTEEEIFEKVWQMTFVKERHSGHVRSTLSSLRKKLPAGCLIFKNQKCYLT